MHPQFARADQLSHKVIAAAIEVHRHFGPGLLEGIYEKALGRELELAGVAHKNQELVRIKYKGFTFEEPLRFDILVEGCLLLELKAVEKVLAVHKAQVLSYMKLLNIPIGLILNFNETRLVDGISRLILPGANLTQVLT